MATKGFTKIDNSILFDLDLTPAAFMLYSKIKHFASIDNFKINREHIKSISGYGETAFRRAWKELKDKGLLAQTKERAKGKFEYTYSLEGVKAVNTKTKAPDPKDDKIHVDSDGNKILEGQITIDDVLPPIEEVNPIKEDVEVVTESTGLNVNQSEELIKAANNNVSKVLESYNYVMQQRGVKSVFSYTKWAIKNSKVHLGTYGAAAQKGYFNNYNQRVYDSKKLERALLYGEEYELPA